MTHRLAALALVLAAAIAACSVPAPRPRTPAASSCRLQRVTIETAPCEWVKTGPDSAICTPPAPRALVSCGEGLVCDDFEECCDEEMCCLANGAAGRVPAHRQFKPP